MPTIYLIESIRDYDTVYKIGYTKSNNAKKRLIQSQTGNDGNLKIVCEFNTKYGTTLEKTLHNFYKHNNIRNEWFSLSNEDITNFIKNCERVEKNFDFLKESNNYFFK